MEKIYEVLAYWHEILVQPDRLMVAAGAVLLMSFLGLVTGALAGYAGPLYWRGVEAAFGGAGDRLNRPGRSHSDLVFRGFLLTVVTLFLALILGRGAQNIVEQASHGRLFEMLVLAGCMASGSVWAALFKLYRTMEKKQVLKGAYYTIARTMRLNFAQSDDFGITRAGLALAARSFDKALVAPAFWYFLLGIPGALVYTALAALSWRFSRLGFSKGFGAVPQALEKLMGFVPSVLAGFLIALSSIPAPGTRPLSAIRLFLNIALGRIKKNIAPYAEGGLPLTCMAWSLDVALGGPVQDITGEAIKTGWVGPGKATAQLGHKHLRRGLVIIVTAHLLFLLSLCGAYLWSGRLFF